MWLEGSLFKKIPGDILVCKHPHVKTIPRHPPLAQVLYKLVPEGAVFNHMELRGLDTALRSLVPPENPGQRVSLTPRASVGVIK